MSPGGFCNLKHSVIRVIGAIGSFLMELEQVYEYFLLYVYIKRERGREIERERE